MLSFSINRTFSAKLALSLVAVAALAACGGGDDAPATTTVVTAPVILAVDTATRPAAIATLSAAKTISFPAAVPLLGTTAATTLTFDTPAAGATAVPFTLASGGVSRKGNLTFGSCIFTITESPVGTVLTPPLVLSTIPTAQCSLSVKPDNATADGTTAPSAVTLTLGTATSNPVAVTLVVQPNGTITVGGVVVGVGTLVQITGAGN